MRTIDRIEGVNATVDKQKALLQKLITNKKAQILGLIVLTCMPLQGCSKNPEEIQIKNKQRQEAKVNYHIEKAKQLQATIPNEIYYIKDNVGICYALTNNCVRDGCVKSITTVPCEKVEHLIYK